MLAPSEKAFVIKINSNYNTLPNLYNLNNLEIPLACLASWNYVRVSGLRVKYDGTVHSVYFLHEFRGYDIFGVTACYKGQGGLRIKLK